MSNYWLVGAMWSGSDDQTDKFVRRGYWFLGWRDDEKPELARLRDQIKPGDRIAIKQMLGQGSPNIRVKAIGIVKEIDVEDKRVYVNWLVQNTSRDVPSKGCYGSIHGPFSEQDDWIRSTFYI